MIESAIRQAIEKLGSRADAQGTCPVCGRRVKSGESRVRAWSGKYAHSRCAAYDRGARQRRSQHSHRVHGRFTAA